MTGSQDRQPENSEDEVDADDRLIDAISGTALHGAPPTDDGAGGLLSSLLMALRRQQVGCPGTAEDHRHDNVVELESRRHRVRAAAQRSRRR